jgi:tRNA 2-thiouridine synthesizing protein D
MSIPKTLTFALMDAPYEQARTTTAFRLLDIAVRRGYQVNVFCYEGAAALAFARQAPHPNAMHGRDAQQEAHPNPKDWIAALLRASVQAGGKLTWINCGLCVDERGVGETIEGVSRGSPADFWRLAEASDNTLVIPTR